jgi:hypothetical protein
VFDVPEDVAEELLKLQANSEIVIHVLKMVRILTDFNFPFVSESGLICPLTRRVWQEGWLECYLLFVWSGKFDKKGRSLFCQSCIYLESFNIFGSETINSQL